MRTARLPLLLLFASSASALTRGCSFATALPRSSHIRAAEPTSTNEVELKRGGTQITRWNPQTSLGYGWSLLSLPFTVTLYLSGSSLLDSVLVQVLGFNRASGDAFGPFVTLLGLIYSILLGQIYEYYFNRQGALYQEISALSHRLPRRSVCTRPALGSVSSVAVSASTRFTLQVRPDRRQAGRPSCDPPRGVALADLREALVQCKVIFCNIHTSWLQGLVSVARGPAALGWPQAARACLGRDMYSFPTRPVRRAKDALKRISKIQMLIDERRQRQHSPTFDERLTYGDTDQNLRHM